MPKMIQVGKVVLFINSQRRCLEYSADEGVNWHRLCSADFTVLLYDKREEKVYATDGRDFCVSKDGGRNWHHISDCPHGEEFIELCLTRSGILAESSQGFLLSRDGGVNWHQV